MANALKHQHGSPIHVVRACYYDGANDLVAIGGDHSVEILQLTTSCCKSLVNFHVGTQISAITWSPKTLSPSMSDEWFIELAVASADLSLHLLSKSRTEKEDFPFGGGLSGHHRKVTDMAFCGGSDSDSARYVASVSDDKMLMVWDLHPNVSTPTPAPEDAFGSPLGSQRPQPTAYVVAFSSPLVSVESHPSSSREFLVGDSSGSIFLTDWRSDPEKREGQRTSLVELVDPRALASASAGVPDQFPGSVAWRWDSMDIVGATYGSKFSVWDMSRLRGGKPFASGPSFLEGGSGFRWCQTHPEYFAISTRSPAKGSVIHVHNYNFVHAQPAVFVLAPRPHILQDFDFVAIKGLPRLAAAVGRDLIIFSVGVE